MRSRNRRTSGFISRCAKTAEVTHSDIDLPIVL
jgi:hypothetical protein